MSMVDQRDWMWSEAVQMLARADRLHRQMFRPSVARASQACWEPPVDVLETDNEVLVQVALPGVVAEQVQVVIEDGSLVIVGQRVQPDELRRAVIHRLEIPQGRFERRVTLPPGSYEAVRRASANGCLMISLLKSQ